MGKTKTGIRCAVGYITPIEAEEKYTSLEVEQHRSLRCELKSLWHNRGGAFRLKFQA